MRKLTAKEIDKREINKVFKRIKSLEKIYHHAYIQSACYNYIHSNLQRRKAIEDLRDAEKRLADAKERLK